LTFDPAAARAWLHGPSETHRGLTRSESLGVDQELTGAGVEGFLTTVADVLAAWPDGLHRRADITAVALWLIPDGGILDQGALITVDLANGLRLAGLHQDIKDFADRDQRGIPAVLSALAHLAGQVCLLLDTYQDTRPGDPDTATSADGTGPATVTEEQVRDALNQAADDVLDAVDAGDEGLRDAVNLTINAAISYLLGDVDNLRDAVEDNYGESYQTVLGWAKAAVR
jgi:hypothetical protein